MPAWRPLAGLIRSLSAFLARDPSQFCRPRFPCLQAGTGSCPPTLALEVGLDARRSAGLHRRCRPTPRLARTRRRRGRQRRRCVRVDGDRKQRWLWAGVGARRAARAWSSRVRGRGHRLLRCRPHPLPDRPRRTGARGWPAAARAPHGRQDRRARRGTRGPQRAHPNAAGNTASGWRTSSATSTCRCPRRSRQRKTGRALPAARPADHNPRAAAQRAAATHTSTAAAAPRDNTTRRPTRSRTPRQPARPALDRPPRPETDRRTNTNPHGRSKRSPANSHHSSSTNPASDRTPPPNPSSPDHTEAGSNPKPHSPDSPAPHPSRPPPDKRPATASTDQATTNSTLHCT